MYIWKEIRCKMKKNSQFILTEKTTKQSMLFGKQTLKKQFHQQEKVKSLLVESIFRLEYHQLTIHIEIIRQ